MKSALSEQHRLIRKSCENGIECLHEGGRLDGNKR